MKESTNNIMEKATTLFMQHGLHAVSMNDIASFSGVSKKTLYMNFQNKEMMIKTIVQKLISKTGIYIRFNPDISPNAVNEIENFAEHILAVHKNVSPRFIRDLKKYYPGVYSQWIFFKDNTVMPYIDRCLNRGIAEEIFRPEINKRNTGWLYCRQIQNVLEGDTIPEEVSRFIENANDLFLHGILNSKGLKLYSVENKMKTWDKHKSREPDNHHHFKN